MKISKIISIVLLLIFINAFSQAKTDESNLYIWDAMKNAEFNKSYKDTFKSYLNVSWVKNPKLGGPMKISNIGIMENLQIYTVCKPHNCGDEHLIFIYQPSTKKSWGKIFIKSESLGIIKETIIDNYLSEFKGEIK